MTHGAWSRRVAAATREMARFRHPRRVRSRRNQPPGGLRMANAQAVEETLLRFLAAVVDEKDRLVQDLNLSSPAREVHALVRDAAQAVIDALAGPPAQPDAPAEGNQPPAAAPAEQAPPPPAG